MSLLSELAHIVGAAESKAVSYPVKAWQTINPYSGYNRAKNFVQTANDVYGWTPYFQGIVKGGYPSITQTLSSGDLKTSKAAAEFIPYNNVNSVQLTPGYGESPAAITHEGLHREWQLNPSDQQKFIQAYNSVIKDSPALQSYLQMRLQDYVGAPKGQGLDQGGVPIPNPAFQDITNLPPEIQNEIHSYIPEFYSSGIIKMPSPLSNYYSQFFNPKTAQVAQPAFSNTKLSILGALGQQLGALGQQFVPRTPAPAGHGVYMPAPVINHPQPTIGINTAPVQGAIGISQPARQQIQGSSINLQPQNGIMPRPAQPLNPMTFSSGTQIRI